MVNIKLNTKKKIIILGISGCGKTNLLNNLIGNNFEPLYLPNWTTKITEKKIFTFYDTSGQDLIPKIIHKNYDFALIVFSNTCRMSYSLIYKYLNVIKNIPYLIIGTCSDLIRDRKVYDNKVINISNKTGKNIHIIKNILINHFNLNNNINTGILNHIC